MGVEVDGQPHLLFQRLDQHTCSCWFQQTRHVFKPKNMGSGGLKLFCHADIVFQIILRAIRVQNVARVANRAFADFVRVLYSIHRDPHVLDPVQAVENTEHVDASLGSLFDEGLNDIVGVVGIAHTVGGAQQHLRHQVRHGHAQIAQALPGAFLQETIGHIEGRAAPALHREELRQVRRIGRGHADHVDRAHTGRQKRLVPVSHRGVGDQKLLLRFHPISNSLRTFFFQKVTGSGGRLGA